MQTDLPADLLATSAGARADAILRSCVHCGFCNATCPTYQLLGDELDGPRGRIYLIKDMLETGAADAVTRTHLDRCLTCRACETTCPSGVRYGELLEIGRERLEAELPRGARERWLRRWLLAVVPRRRRFRRWVRLGRLLRPLLPRRLAGKVPPAPRPRSRPEAIRSDDAGVERRVLLLDGCVQSVTTPGGNEALSALLASRGIRVESVVGEGCCGALALHLGELALPHLEPGVETHHGVEVDPRDGHPTAGGLAQMRLGMVVIAGHGPARLGREGQEGHHVAARQRRRERLFRVRVLRQAAPIRGGINRDFMARVEADRVLGRVGAGLEHGGSALPVQFDGKIGHVRDPFVADRDQAAAMDLLGS